MIYDIAIIGGGPAGYTAAQKATHAGLKVVLFEKSAIGGTCLNVGCIPTKTLLYSAKQYINASNSAKYGLDIPAVSFNYQKMQQRKQKVVRKLAAGIRQQIKDCTFVAAEASVTDYSEEMITITAANEVYQAHNLLIATGSTNFVPPIEGIESNPQIWDSTAALEATELPDNIAIIGGGVIGLEFATLFSELGVKVTIIEALPHILPNIDSDIVDYLTQSYTKKGIKILTSTRVQKFAEGKIIVQTADGEQAIEAAKVLVCVGRKANLKGLEVLDKLELKRGAIKVNDFMQTNLKNVYAAGDVTGKMMLAHVASRQAEVAVGRILKQIPLQRIAYNAIPSVVYTNPEIATIGLTEQQVEQFYKDMEGKEGNFYTVKKLPMTFSGRFVAENEQENGLCKVIIDNRNQTILGVHCIGNPASEFIAAASFAVRMGYTVAEFQQVVFPHPTVSEILRETIIA